MSHLLLILMEIMSENPIFLFKKKYKTHPKCLV